MSEHEKGQKAGAAHIGRIDHRAVEAVGKLPARTPRAK